MNRSAPSDGVVLTTATELEAANATRIEKLLAMGCPEALLNAIAIQVRVEAIVSVLPDQVRQHLELQYEAALGKELEDFMAQVAKPKIFVPTGVASTAQWDGAER